MSRFLTGLSLRQWLLAGILVVLAITAIVQTVRLEGFKLWPISIEGASPRAERLEDEIGAMIRDQHAAELLAKAQKDAQEAAYAAIAKGVDDAFEEGIGAELAAAARFVAANRVRCPAVGSSTGAAAAPARDHGARGGDARGGAAELDATDPAVDPDADWVAVRADDVRICTVNTLQAEAARAWAVAIEAESRSPGQP